ALVRTVLEIVGHRVQEAVDGLQGLAAFEAERPDLVLCDIFMPEQNGIRTIRAIRQLDSKVPILVMSGGPSWDKSSSRLFLAAAQHFETTVELEKPFTASALLAAVRQALPAPADGKHLGKAQRTE